MDRSLVAFFSTGRRDLLCCFIEAGWTDSVLSVLRPDDAHQGMVACWQRRFSDAIKPSPGSRLPMPSWYGHGHLLSGDLDATDAAFDAFDRHETSFSQTLEVWLCATEGRYWSRMLRVGTERRRLLNLWRRGMGIRIWRRTWRVA